MNPQDEWEDPGNPVMNVYGDDTEATVEAGSPSGSGASVPWNVDQSVVSAPGPRPALEDGDWVDPGQPAVRSNPFWPDL